MSLKILEDLADKIGNFSDTAYENNWLHYAFIGLIILAILILIFGSQITFE